ncbi:penicillin-binding transpeptidase domain-containing protein, partial [Staphylococcus haemolyticus]|uniref:penicillin-binding transpeptidase domain-containing protein n=1 Tax=Staphylococcus haemolyticus TaxID=1283 RepID=UPI00374F8833
MHTKTTEILPFTQRPTFNPHTPQHFPKKSPNHLYQNTYQPPSTFKSFPLPPPIHQPNFNPNKKYHSPHPHIMP